MVFYDGEVIAQGSAKEIREALKDLWKAEKSGLKTMLDELLNKVQTIVGKYSKRSFNPKKAGGEILNLSWNNAKITKEGIETVKKHLGRLEFDDWNIRMIERLEKIESGKIPSTDFDKRFYTHEVREFERYKNLGYENTHHKNIPDEVWDNAHAATLEDYQLYEKMIYNDKDIYSLYHPDVQY